MTRAIDIASSGDIAAAAVLMQTSLAQSDAQPTPLQHAVSVALSGTQRILAGHYYEELPQVLPVLGEIERSDYADKVDWLYTSIGFALGNLGDPERGLEWTARALAMTENTPSSVGCRKALNTQGALLAMLDQHDASMDALTRALQIAVDQGVARSQAICLGNLSFACLDRAMKLEGEATQETQKQLARRALDYADRAHAIAEAHDIAHLSGFAASNRGFSLLLLGEIAQAREIFLAARPLTQAHDDIHVDVLLGIAMADRQLGNFAEARRQLGDAEALARREHFEVKLGRVLEEGVRLETAAGNTAGALDWSQRHVNFLKQHYPNRLKMLARSAELFADAERARREAVALRAQSREWQDAALRDTLTGALNRRGLAARAAELLASERPLAAAAFDADHFKQVNDRFGHATGDAVLIALSQIITSHTRDGDIFARIGGEEFVLLLPTTVDVALATCERIRAAIEAHDWQSVHTGLRLTTSIGLAARQEEGSLEPLIARADNALYAAKQAGRNRICVAD